MSNQSVSQASDAIEIACEVPSAIAPQGDYDIVNVEREGFAIGADGKKKVYAVVEWAKNLVPREDVVWTKPVDWGLTVNDLKLVKTDDPVATAVVERQFSCDFCPARFIHNYSRRKHERKCTGPGGPKHVCRLSGRDFCKNDCPGRVEYIPCEDRRRFNGLRVRSNA